MFLVDLRELAVAQIGAGHAVHVPTSAALDGTSDSGASDQASDGADGTKRGKGRPRVLVVEDSVGVRELQRVILEGAGYDVITAVDGQDGAAGVDPGRLHVTGFPVTGFFSEAFRRRCGSS